MHWSVLAIMALTAIVLIVGIVGMVRGGKGSAHTATKLMSLRVLLQAIAIALLVLTAAISG